MAVLDHPVTRRVRASTRLLGPAFVAAIAYVDPGNVATNITAGAAYGYLLLWVLVVANAMAVLVQYLSAKLGLVTGRSLPESLRRADASRVGWRTGCRPSWSRWPPTSPRCWAGRSR